jgi:hypothetical protein
MQKTSPSDQGERARRVNGVRNFGAATDLVKRTSGSSVDEDNAVAERLRACPWVHLALDHLKGVRNLAAAQSNDEGAQFASVPPVCPGHSANPPHQRARGTPGDGSTWMSLIGLIRRTRPLTGK